MKLYEKIQYCRKKEGLSQADLADRLGVSRQSVSKWETGESNPDVTKIPLLAKVLGVTADWLLSEEEPEGPKPIAERCLREEASAYPDWVNNLPKHMLRMIKRIGWLYGVRIAVGGFLISTFGVVARVMFRSMILGAGNTMSGMLGTGFGSFNPLGSFDTALSGFTSQAWTTASIFTGFMIGLGLLIAVAGIVLSLALKKWGSNQES